MVSRDNKRIEDYPGRDRQTGSSVNMISKEHSKDSLLVTSFKVKMVWTSLATVFVTGAVLWSTRRTSSVRPAIVASWRMQHGKKQQ